MRTTAAPMAMPAMAPGESEDDEELDVVESLDDTEVGEEGGLDDLLALS
jgi:hypothetical protein